MTFIHIRSTQRVKDFRQRAVNMPEKKPQDCSFLLQALHMLCNCIDSEKKAITKNNHKLNLGPLYIRLVIPSQNKQASYLQPVLILPESSNTLRLRITREIPHKINTLYKSAHDPWLALVMWVY